MPQEWKLRLQAVPTLAVPQQGKAVVALPCRPPRRPVLVSIMTPVSQATGLLARRRQTPQLPVLVHWVDNPIYAWVLVEQHTHVVSQPQPVPKHLVTYFRRETVTIQGLQYNRCVGPGGATHPCGQLTTFSDPTLGTHNRQEKRLSKASHAKT
jgi:hypothetical protein